MLKISVYENNPLPIYIIDWNNRPKNWEGKTVFLQKLYLKNRNGKDPFFFDDTIEELRNLATSSELIEIKNSEKTIALAFSAMNLFDIYCLFWDKKVTEAFCNKIGNRIVISHLTYGRCVTSLEFTLEFWKALKTRAEYDSNNILSPSTPALKVGFKTPLGNFRISLQDYPLSSSGPIFNIRRLPSKPISLEHLVKIGQISSKYTQILKKAFGERKNIVIAGEPGSGKTTLANSLILLGKPSWRLIIMEDAREINIDPGDFPMAIHFALPAIGEDSRYQKRSEEIARLLHRSPDYVFLGELQNQEDTQVAFEGFAAGIRGMATTHAKTLGELLSRWKDSHKLGPNLLSTIDLVVMTSKKLENGIAKLSVQSIHQQSTDGWEVIKDE